jgi:hypothetical protein
MMLKRYNGQGKRYKRFLLAVPQSAVAQAFMRIV